MAESSHSSGAKSLAHIRLQHFLYMGIEGNYYIPGKRQFSTEAVHCIESLIADGKGSEAVQEVIRIAKNGLSIYPDALLYALALCARSKESDTKSLAFQGLNDVCKTSAELFAFTRYLEEVSKPTTGWGRAHRRALANWYNSKKPKELAVQVTRYICRHRWTHKDLLRLGHTKPANDGVAIIFKYLTKGLAEARKDFDKEGASPEVKEVLEYLQAVQDLKHATDEQLAARLIETHDLMLEHIPTPLLKSKEVWTSLIPRIPLQTLLQQLPRLQHLGFLKHNTHLTKILLERLRSDGVLAESHLGPVETFVACRQCEVSNKLALGKPPQTRHRRSQVEDALHSLHISSFKMVPSTGKRYLVVVDVRNPMVHGKVIGCPNLTPADAAALLLMSLARAEGPNLSAAAFSMTGLVSIDINTKMSHADVTRRMRETPMGPVNMSAPFHWAMEKKMAVDVILICTDNQTQPGDVHPAEALKEYRKTMNLPHTRFIVCAVSSHSFSLAPPEEPGMLDIAGFDYNVLRVIQDFAHGIF